MDLYFEVAANRSAGTRDQQRGAYHTAYLGEDGGGDKAVLLAVMADGVEGHSGGQVASNHVVSTFHRTLRRRIGTSTFPALLRESMDAANSALGDAIDETPELEGMACTAVSVLLVAGRVHWASVGDSGLFLIRDGELRRLNDDHSYGAFLEQARLAGVDATPDPGLTPDMLMSAVTGKPIDDMDCPNQGFDLEGGDRLILAGRRLLAAGEEAMLGGARGKGQAEAAVTALMGAVEADSGEQEEGTSIIVVDVFDREAGRASAAAAAAAEDESPRPAAAVAQAARPSGVLDALAGVAALLVFLGTAAGSWYGLGELNAWRAANRAASQGVPGTVAVAPPAPGGTLGSGAGLSIGGGPAPPAIGMPAAGQRGGLTFGAPAPLAIGAAPEAPSASTTVVDGFRDALADGSEGPLMVRLPAGSFQMGSRSQTVNPAASPRRQVSVGAFAMSVFEVTVAQYNHFASATGRPVPKIPVLDPETTPVSRVSWDDAYAYTLWLSQQTGQRYRLPSEAEWEYAARGGTTTSFWWGNQVGKDRAHCVDCNTGLDTRSASRVGRFEPNPFGLHDTAGNLAEWVHDCWHPNYRGAPTDGGVWEGGDCQGRVVRGGGFGSTSKSIRSSARESVPATQTLETIGIRIARDL